MADLQVLTGQKSNKPNVQKLRACLKAELSFVLT